MSFQEMNVVDLSRDVQIGLTEDMARGLDIEAERVSIVNISPGSVIISVEVTGFNTIEQAAAFRELVLESTSKKCLLPSKYAVTPCSIMFGYMSMCLILSALFLLFFISAMVLILSCE